jgi:hypothetical protein
MVPRSRHRRQGPVPRLGRRILKAEARGDWDLYARLLSNMADIVTGGAPEDFFEAIAWIAAHDDAFDQALRQHLWRHPELLVKMVKVVRARAANPHVSEATRREARAVLAQCGFDDASLRHEDNELRKPNNS